MRAVDLMDAVMRGQVPADVQVWESEVCQCGRLVQFLPGQVLNRCAWCGNTVTHAVG